MPTEQEIGRWKDTINTRYLNYLKTSFYFKDATLRESFRNALDNCDLMKGHFPETAHHFQAGINAHALAKEYFSKHNSILPALSDVPLYSHQEQAIRKAQKDCKNIVVASGTASGKTEAFLYPILFELYQQHLDEKLSEPGVRALILYPMNALANDQRRRLGGICKELEKENSDFKPTFGQYIGATPENKIDKYRNPQAHEENRFPGELIFREEMRNSPPHILLTNYSMLEYLLIRPVDSELFDGNRGRHWQFIVLDEAHQYRGSKGMEMSMLVRRLKQRLRAGGRKHPFCCIATSATLSSNKGPKEKQSVANFASALFGEPFLNDDVIFGKRRINQNQKPQRYHLFMSALEGAFLSYKNGKDEIILNRKTEISDEQKIAALEIALCRECGQHYYVGQEDGGYLIEAIRDPSHKDFGVNFYLPLDDDSEVNEAICLCRQCGKISKDVSVCECDASASISVKRCANHEEKSDQIKECESCKYKGRGDPVHEIIHGSDAPNSVIATALHGLLPKGERRKILAFADSRQEAAFFAWYAEHSYQEIRDRNFMLRALKKEDIGDEGLSIKDLQSRLQQVCNDAGLFSSFDTKETQRRETLGMIFRELLTNEKRIALDGVGLTKWFVQIPANFPLPKAVLDPPWSFTQDEGRELLGFLLDYRLRQQRAVCLPEGAPSIEKITLWGLQSVTSGTGGGSGTFSWGGVQTSVVKHFLRRLLSDSGLSEREVGKTLMGALWDSIQNYGRNVSGNEKLLVRAQNGGTFHLNSAWIRIKLPLQNECFECNTCARLSFYNLRGVCPRNGCPGELVNANQANLAKNHYRVLYEDSTMPAQLRAAEHTAQLQSDEAQKRQDDFINGNIDLLSSSTTFEVGVDLGDLEVVFLRNVPPEPFNYTQRVGRAGRRGSIPGLALTYCRRNPHDLYHYTDPEEHILKGRVYPPQLRLKNEKIILRHITAVALSAFFRKSGNNDRFKNVECLIGGDWGNPRVISDFRNFCQGSTKTLGSALRAIVPEDMHEKVGLTDNDSWIDIVAGEDSRFAYAERDVCEDYCRMHEKRDEYRQQDQDNKAAQIGKRMKTISKDNTLSFLSRKAIIPKYGFPVDVVELDTRPYNRDAYKVSLQRDLSQAIAEYAPGSKVVANKKEWESRGVKIIPGKSLEVRCYHYDQARDFKQWDENDPPPDGVVNGGKKYLWPQFGFVTALFQEPKEPKGRVGRMYTTRPFFRGFQDGAQEKQTTTKSFGISVTPALPGRMVVLCEGKNGSRFYICQHCGAGFPERQAQHKTPENNECKGTLKSLALGHEFVTDVVRLQFPGLIDQWAAYSLAYALLLGVAQRLDVPDTDLNATITVGKKHKETAIVLYDNVPGGAGLVASLEKEDVFLDVLKEAKNRVKGDCGCTESCYGCVRSYRNQFAHPHLQRKTALRFLEVALEKDVG